MRRSTSLKLIVLVPVVFATWFVTSSLMAGPSKIARREVLRHTLTPASQPLVEDPTRVPVRMTYEYYMTSFEVQVQGGNVGVSSSVNMTDRIGDKSYLWRLQAFRYGTVEPVVDVPYDGQMFMIHPSGKMSPSFSEVFTLPKGRHRVTLTLYALPKGFDVSHLNDANMESEFAVLVNAKEVVVQ